MYEAPRELREALEQYVLDGSMKRRFIQRVRHALTTWRLPVLGLEQPSLEPYFVSISELDGEVFKLALEYGTADRGMPLTTVITAPPFGFSLAKGGLKKDWDADPIDLKRIVLTELDEVEATSTGVTESEMVISFEGTEYRGKGYLSEPIQGVRFSIQPLGIEGAVVCRNQPSPDLRLTVVRDFEPFFAAMANAW